MIFKITPSLIAILSFGQNFVVCRRAEGEMSRLQRLFLTLVVSLLHSLHISPCSISSVQILQLCLDLAILSAQQYC